MMKISVFIYEANKYYDKIKDDKNSSDLSWEHCYKCFYESRGMKEDENLIDRLSLNLAFYLASWGMYRSSSFLFKKDYKVHYPIVREILNEKYECLQGINCCCLKKEDNKDKLKELIDNISVKYGRIRGKDTTTPVSSTLISKVLLGCLGCVPAYDTKLTSVIKAEGIVSTKVFNIESILGLVDYYVIEKVRKGFICEGGIEYPQMKVLDMGFWQYGDDNGY